MNDNNPELELVKLKLKVAMTALGEISRYYRLVRDPFCDMDDEVYTTEAKIAQTALKSIS